MKKKLIIGLCSLILIGGGITFTAIQHNHDVQAKQIAQQEKEAKIKKEKEVLQKAKSSVDQAYDTRDNKDIDSANKAIDKLSNRQEKEKTELSDRMKKLKGFITQLSELNASLDNTKKSKKEADINAVQSLIDKLTDSYLEKDKASIQEQLNALKKQIEEEQKAKETAQRQANIEQPVVTPSGQEQANQNYASDNGYLQSQAPNNGGYTNEYNNSYQPPAQGGGGGGNTGSGTASNQAAQDVVNDNVLPIENNKPGPPTKENGWGTTGQDLGEWGPNHW